MQAKEEALQGAGSRGKGTAYLIVGAVGINTLQAIQGKPLYSYALSLTEAANTLKNYKREQVGRAYIIPASGSPAEEFSTYELEGVFNSLPSSAPDTLITTLGRSVEDYFSAPDTAHTFAAEVAAGAQKSHPYRVARIFDTYIQAGNYTEEDRANLFGKIEEVVFSSGCDYNTAEEVYNVITRYTEASEANKAYFRFSVDNFRAWVDNRKQRLEEEAAAVLLEDRIQAARDYMDLNRPADATKILREALQENESKQTAAQFAKDFARPADAAAAEKALQDLPEGISTGLYLLTEEGEVQEVTFKEGVSLIAGARKHGKTTLLMNIALNEAKKNLEAYKAGLTPTLKKVVFYSYEVQRARLLLKFLGMYLNNPDISSNSARSILAYYKGKPEYFAGYSEAAKHHEAAPAAYTDFLARKDAFYNDYIVSGALTIVDTPYKVGGLIAATDHFLQDNEISLICLDYIQEVTAEGRYNSRVEELKYIGEALRLFANTKGLPFVCAAQFNREVESLIDVVTKNIGEAGDLERNGVDVLGVFNLKELGAIRGSDTEITLSDNIRRLTRFGVKGYLSEVEVPKPTASNPDAVRVVKTLQPVAGKMYIRLMASRFDEAPAEVIVDFAGSTGYIDIKGSKTKAEIAHNLRPEVIEAEIAEQEEEAAKGIVKGRFIGGGVEL